MNSGVYMRRITSLFVGLCVLAICGVASATYVTGSITNNTGIDGRVYVMLERQNADGGFDSTGLGTSEPSVSGTPVSYTIRGINASSGYTGEYRVKAFLDTRGNRVPCSISPWGNSGATLFTFVNDVTGVPKDETGKNINLAVSSSTVKIPVGVKVAPTSGGALVIWDVNDPSVRTPKLPAGTITTSSNFEINDSYEVAWATNSGFTAGVGSRVVTSQDDGHLAVTGLGNGSSYYFRVRGKRSTNTSGWSTSVGPLTIGTPAGGQTVSGSVNFTSAGQNGTLVLVLFNDVSNTYYWTTVAQAGQTSQSYSVGGVQPGSYGMFTFLDKNTNGVYDAGDIASPGEPTITVAAAAVTAPAVEIPVTSSLSALAVGQRRNIAANGDILDFSYTVSLKAADQLKEIAKAEVSIPGVTVPVDLGVRQMDSGFSTDYELAKSRPRNGASFTFTFSYTDGSDPEVITVPASEFYDSFPRKVTAGMVPFAAGRPILTWSPISPLPPSGLRSMVLMVEDAANGARVWQRTVDPALGSIQYNDDGTASLTTLVNNHQYRLHIELRDGNDNGGFLSSEFTPTTLPVITGFSSAAAQTNDTLTVYGFNFEADATTISFNCDGTPRSGVVNGSGTQFTVDIPYGACTGPVSATTSVGQSPPNYEMPFYSGAPISFTGSLRDSSGQAVAGAVVSLRHYPQVTTTTAANGSFTLSGLPYDFRLKIMKPGYYDTYSSYLRSTANIVAPDSFTMFTPAEIEATPTTVAAWRLTIGNPVARGIAVDYAGAPLSGATVTATNNSDIALAVRVLEPTLGMVMGTTYANGIFFVINGFQNDGTTVVTSKTGYDFTPQEFSPFNFAITEGPMIGIPRQTIAGFTPSSARPGATIAINGSFVLPYDRYSVKFNGLSGAVVGGDSTSLLVVVPSGATTGKVDVLCSATAITVTSATNFSPLYRLTLSFLGAGSGSANSITPGVDFSCSSPDICTKDVIYNTTFSLRATPSFGSLFDKWTGGCTGTGDCSITLPSDKSARATFTVAPYVKSGGVFYGTIGNAYAVVGSGSQILAQAIQFPGLDFDRTINVVLTGGFDSGFMLNPGYTSVVGPLTVTSGEVTFDRIIIK